MKRGRKPGSSHRWTDFSDARLWATLEHIMRRDNLQLRPACRRLAYSGYFQVRAGKVWITRKPTDADTNAEAIREFMKNCKVGDQRKQDIDPVEVFRARYYIVDRRRQEDPEFRSDCDFWLRVNAEKEGAADDMEAFFRAFDS